MTDTSEPTALQVAEAAAEDLRALRLRVEAVEAFILRRPVEPVPQWAIDEAIAAQRAAAEQAVKDTEGAEAEQEEEPTE